MVMGGMDEAMGMMAPPPSSGMRMPGDKEGGGRMTMMHMAFYWSSHAQILFSRWPGDRGLGMYFLALLLVSASSALIESLSSLSGHLSQPSNTGGRRASTALLLTAVHAARMGLAYLVMLAVMSFNVGVLIAAVVGHALGFFITRSGIFKWARGTQPNHHRTLPTTKI